RASTPSKPKDWAAGLTPLTSQARCRVSAAQHFSSDSTCAALGLLRATPWPPSFHSRDESLPFHFRGGIGLQPIASDRTRPFSRQFGARVFQSAKFCNSLITPPRITA